MPSGPLPFSRQSTDTLAAFLLGRAAPAHTQPAAGANPSAALPTLEPIIIAPGPSSGDSTPNVLRPPGLAPSYATSAGLACIYISVIAVCALIVILASVNPDVVGRAATSVIALVLLAIVPSIMLVAFLVMRFQPITDFLQLALTTCWAIALMAPLVLVVQAIIIAGGSAFARVNPWLSIFLVSYVQAGLLEEALKFNAIRAILWKDVVADPRALLVYSCGAANGFALVENLLYVLSSGLVTGVVRAFLSVPAHTAWGMISGSLLAERKFLGKSHPWPLIVLRPAVLHGTYNFSLFAIDLLAADTPLWAYILLVAIAPIVTLGSLVYVYRLSRKLDAVPFVEVRALQKAGLLPRATLCSCLDDCVACLPFCGRRLEARMASTSGRNQQAASLQQLELEYRLSQAARDQPATGAPASAGGAPAPRSSRAIRTGQSTSDEPAADARFMLVSVPAGVAAGAMLEVVSPFSAQQRFAVRVPPQASPGWQMVVQHPAAPTA